MQSGCSIPAFETVCQLYAEFLATMWPALRPCPQCHAPREIQGDRRRALQWASDHIDFIALTRLRCRGCHTVETLFPPWIVPYELAALWILEAAVIAVAVDGDSLQHTANRWQWTLAWARAHVRSWMAVGPECRMLVAQWSRALGWDDLVSITWHPPATAVAGDWAWLRVAWATLAIQVLDWAPAQYAPGWIVWQSLAPEVLPAAPIPAVTHLGRRLRQCSGSPP
jgi:hypothetical protein